MNEQKQESLEGKGKANAVKAILSSMNILDLYTLC
ncbi:hypothetical protein M2138_001951 [Dysgonomonadaceae bacterium PH5-43]|nr:hypothetical protein [Dysgonomonadaceae bacterium PH5-43]